ncbi:MAG TPA: peptidylprolyl isomerase [Candidatus Polarisedimenticolia bacterium]|nr:peptidylprolyl isomerase [Candidatus Polarisedimenticolia bacterium]
MTVTLSAVLAALLGGSLLLSAPSPQTAPVAAEPEHIQVQHCLVAFAGKVPGKNVTRTQEEARKLAYDILERAKKGEDFDALVKQHTDDSHPGIYGMANKGVAPATGEFRREGMVPAFGDVGFKLKVGEVGIADFDERTSPYGWHVIKRVK